MPYGRKSAGSCPAIAHLSPKKGEQRGKTPFPPKNDQISQMTKSSIAAANGPHIEAIGLFVAAHEAIAKAHGQTDVAGTGISSTSPIEAELHINKSITF